MSFQQLKALPKIYWIFFGLVFAAEAVVFALHPDDPGLYQQKIQFIPLTLTLPFLFFRDTRKNFKRYFYTYFFAAFAALAIDYLANGHAGLFQITTTFCPAFLYWIIIFARWNFARFKERESRAALALSTIAWGFFALAFPPLPLGPAALVLLVPWFTVLNNYSRKAIIFATFWSGMLYNAINYYWIYNVMHVDAAPGGLILFGLVLLIAYLTAYNVLAAFIYSLARNIRVHGHTVLLWLFPLFYAGLEMTRTRGDFAFPWSHLGYAFGNHLELLQSLSVIGIFGYTILIIASNMVVAKAIFLPGIRGKWPLITPLVIFFALLIHGSTVLSAPEAAPFYGADSENTPTMALVQPSIHQGEKWSKARYDSIITKTVGMIEDSVAPGTDLIILAETAIPDHIKRQPKTVAKFHHIANQRNAYILTGALDFKRIREPGALRRYEVYNASFLFTPGDDSFPQRYIKKHLVPFSERIPFDDIFPILNYVDLGEGDFVPGKETPVYGPYNWTPFICYDAIFGDLVREAIGAGTRLMVNITNDGWFGRSTAPYQHLNLVRYRAIENGIPVARMANSGVSSFIDQYGHYDQNTEIFTDRVIQRKMQLKTRDTIYQHIGDGIETVLLWFFLLYVLAAFGVSFYNYKKSGPKAATL